jgi:predicted Zn-dependent protease
LGEYIGIGTNRLVSRSFKNNWRELFDGAIETTKAQVGRRACSPNTVKQYLLSHQVIAKLLVYGLVPSFLVSNNLYQNALLSDLSFNENIILMDDPTFPGGQNSFGFDDEGYPTKPRVLVAKNRIKRLLGMNFQCQTMHSTNKYRGNCYRTEHLKKDYRDYSFPPQIAASNFVLKARKADDNSLLNNITDGLYIKDIVGFQDIDFNTGDFVVSIVEGYRIHNGDIVHPILPCFCAGNVYSILGDSTLLLGSELKEIDIDGAPLSVITPELVTNQIKISD